MPFFALSEADAKRVPVFRSPRCGQCKLDVSGCQSPKMKVYGKGKRQILIVGEAPGATEDRAGRPFQGKAGQRLLSTSIRLGVDLFHDCWVVNALRCFVGTTRVESPSGITKLYRRRYSGELIRIQTSTGRVLTGTPNHPILTPNGWVHLGLLKEGDDLVCYTSPKRVFSSGTDVDDPPPTFEQVFNSTSQLGDHKRMVGRGVDFHGDGEDREVDVVGADGLLTNRNQIARCEHREQFSLVPAHESQVGLNSKSTGFAHTTDQTPRMAFAAGGLVRRFGEGQPAKSSNLPKTEGHGIAAPPKRDTQSSKDVPKPIVGDAEGVRERLKSLPGVVSLDRVVYVERETCDQPLGGDNAAERSCHVYNLESGHGYYIADGIVVSNCRPPDNKINDPKKVDFCRPFTIRDIEELKPRVIICLGAMAVRSVIGYLWREDPGGVKKWMGYQIPSQRWNAWVCSTFHPSHLDRMEGEQQYPLAERYFTEHLLAAYRLEGRPWKRVPDYNNDVMVMQDPRAAVPYLDAFYCHPEKVAFDFETTTLKPDGPDADIVCCSISDGATTISYPWVGECIELTRKILRAAEIPKIGFNLKFEDRWARAKLGCRVRGWAWDGQLAAHAMDARGEGTSSLKFQAFARLGFEDYSGSVAAYLKADGGGNAKNKIRRVSLPKLLLYNGLDSLLEYKIAHLQAKEMGVEL